MTAVHIHLFCLALPVIELGKFARRVSFYRAPQKVILLFSNLKTTNIRSNFESSRK